MPVEVADLEAVNTAVLRALPRFSIEEQRLGLALYRQLARGRPVPVESVADSAGLPAKDAATLLGRDPLRALIYRDDQERLVGFAGLAVLPMHHRFAVEGRQLYTWCAWDSLFLPELLGTPALVESVCPETGTMIKLSVTPDRIGDVDPSGAVMSFVLPDAAVLSTTAANVVTSFCHHIFFLASAEAGARWTARHEGTFLLTLDQAFEMAKRANAATFGAGGNEP
ncbi:MAG: organomercurial lyase [Gemmatimonadales bacterium]